MKTVHTLTVLKWATELNQVIERLEAEIDEAAAQLVSPTVVLDAVSKSQNLVAALTMVLELPDSAAGAFLKRLAKKPTRRAHRHKRTPKKTL